MMNDLQNQTEEAGDVNFQFNALYELSINHISQPELAISYAEKALAFARKEGNQAWEAKSLEQLGTLYAMLQQFEKSIDYWNQETVLAAKDDLGKARLLLNTGSIYLQLEQWKNARDTLEKSLTLLRKVKDTSGMMSGCLGYLGVTYRELGKPKKALPHLIEALKIVHASNYHRMQISNSGNIGYCYQDLKQQREAIPYFVQALMLAEESNDLQRMGKYASEVGESYLLLQQEEKAFPNLELSYAIGVEIDDRRMALNAAWFLRQLYRKAEQFLYAAYMEDIIASHHQEIGDAEKSQHHAKLAQELRKTDRDYNKTTSLKRMSSSKSSQLSPSISTMRETILVKKQQGKIVNDDTESEKMSEWKTESKNLAGIDLSGKNLSGVDFVSCNLAGANLAKSNLRMSDLDMANLQKANLKRANLWGSEMSETNLREANLEGADIGATILMDCNLTNANLKRAYLLGAVVMSNVDMTGANLENAIIDKKLLKRAILTNAIMPDGSLYEEPELTTYQKIVRIFRR